MLIFAFSDGLHNASSFPVELFSLYLTDENMLGEALPATNCLYQLVAHPCTDLVLANRVLLCLLRLLRQIPSGRAKDTEVDISSAVTSLSALGANSVHFEEDLRESAALQDENTGMDVFGSNEALVTFTYQQRQAASYRILQIVKVLIQTKYASNLSKFDGLTQD